MDLEQALVESEELIEMWLKSQRFPDFPAFSGGVLDAWPAWAVEGFSIANLERRRIDAFLASETQR